MEFVDDANVKVEIPDKAKELHDAINKAINVNNVDVKTKPKLIISAWCHAHIKAMHKASPDTEWLAKCKIENLWNGVFRMTDMIHPPQECSSTLVETADWAWLWEAQYLEKVWLSDWDWNCVLHSHHRMNAFWSGTDDDQRLRLNDGRELARAVVTNYSGDNIWYKGCVNFYKPYNIEIDCDIEYEDVDYETLCNSARADFDTEVENRYCNLIQDNIALLDELKGEYSFDNVINYLWIDIRKELEINNIKISNKLPQKEYNDKLNELYIEATSSVKSELYDKYKDEYEFYDWNNVLMKQWKDNAKSRYSYTAKPVTVSNYNTNDISKIESKIETPESEKIEVTDEKWITHTYDYDQWKWGEIDWIYHYTEDDYPTKAELVEDFSLPLDFDAIILNGEWFALSKNSGEYDYLDVVLEEKAEELYARRKNQGII